METYYCHRLIVAYYGYTQSLYLFIDEITFNRSELSCSHYCTLWFNLFLDFLYVLITQLQDISHLDHSTFDSFVIFILTHGYETSISTNHVYENVLF